ncbi:hypothetical protein AAL_01175 [Moelleriella libera RCEF 2490]|uniref:Uncharacterized protein n=1 Tax=Moelleriella libera RCEF 2490 TaxID=1081109 RepID=A0A166VIU1_9HYPO|nr:hypothetical protein AAL_01175 [Moelleriella libera RCEF 2490]
MASRSIVPRFLLPLQGPLWRGLHIPMSQSVRIRYASSSSSSSPPEKPIVLEKPAKFNPPSHGSRLKRNTIPKHYGPNLTPAEAAAQSKRDYPGMMAPEGTWSHWFWHSRLLHTFITMPTYFFAAWKNVVSLHEQDKAAKAGEHRTRHLDDIAKRRYYMKVHGIEAKDPVAMVFGKGEEKSVEELEAAAMGKDLPRQADSEANLTKKKWLGIW